MQTKPEPTAPLHSLHTLRRRAGCATLMALLAPLALGWDTALATDFASPPDPSPFPEVMAKPELLAQLRAGGYVLYMRHGTTDNNRADAVTGLRLDDCSTQRVLNDKGRRLAVILGNTLRQARIPVAEIVYSPLCRTTETAKLAYPDFRGPMHADPDLMYTANLTSAQKKPVLQATRRLVSTPPPAGSNRLIVAHAPNLADLMGYFVKPEGTVVVLRPQGANGFEYLASIPPALWPQLMKAAPAP